MKELELRVGEHIAHACKRLAAEAPSFMEFNGIRIEALGSESAADLQTQWDLKSRERHEQYLGKQKRREEAQAALIVLIRDQIPTAIEHIANLTRHSERCHKERFGAPCDCGGDQRLEVVNKIFETLMEIQDLAAAASEK